MGIRSSCDFQEHNTLDLPKPGHRFGLQQGVCLMQCWSYPGVRRTLAPVPFNPLNCVCRTDVKVKHEQVRGCHTNSHCHLREDKCKRFGCRIQSFYMCAWNFHKQTHQFSFFNNSKHFYCLMCCKVLLLQVWPLLG